jgi:phosphoenolpyruvate---glycerone phosphotransferase subunit DhaK
MKKFVNDVELMLQESLQGMAAAHGDLIALHLDPTFVTRKELSGGKVALISGGGSGHEPLHCGFIGTGMLDAACPGQVFTSPTPDQMMAAAASVDRGQGVLFIVKNYAGDVMNFQMAAEMMEQPCATVLVNDDVAIERSTHGTGRRGVAGTLIVEKIVGAAAEAGASLEQCKVLGDRVNSCTASMGVAFTSCTVPAAGRVTFDIADNEMEFGVGIHGEPGRRRGPVRPAAELVDELMAAILSDLKPKTGAQVLLHVNGFGGTPLIELYLLYHCANQLLDKQGLKIARSLVGNYTTSLEMAGASLTVTLMDEELKSLWDAPVHTAALRW